MRRNASGMVLGVMLLMTALGLASCSKSTSAPDANTAKAVRFVQAMAGGSYVEATQQFDAAVAAAMPADRLKQTWEGLVALNGALRKLGKSRTAHEDGFDVVYVPMEFEKVTLDAKVVFGRDGKISGLWFVEHIAAAEAEYSAPGYADAAAFSESEVSVGTGEWKLPGTLSMPEGAGPFAAVVLVHGSGQQDRDETIGANKPFKDLAAGLASQGVAVLRYDKRTKVHPKRIAAIRELTVKEEVLDDAAAATRLLRGRERINPGRIFVLGHSLGGMLIPRIGKNDPGLAGLIVMAGPTRPLEDIIVEQAQYLSSLSGPSKEADKELKELKALVVRVKDPKLSASAPAILGAPGSYWLDLRGYRPAETAKSLKQPMLILQGGRDYQVTRSSFDIWREALAERKDVTFKLYPKLNHLFGEGEGKSVPQEYQKRTPVPQYVIDDIAGWVKSHS